MYLIYILDLHDLLNESKKSIFSYKYDQREYIFRIEFLRTVSGQSYPFPL